MLLKKIKRYGTGLLAICLILSSVQHPARDVKAASGDNLALAATASASSSEGSNLAASQANDGKKNTRWASGTSGEAEWLQLAWDSEQTVKSFVIEWERRNPTDYEIAVSNDGSDWSNVVWTSTTKPTEFRQEITLAAAESAKYVRLNIKSFDPTSEGKTWNTVSVYEFEVYEDEIPKNRKEIEKIASGLTAPVVKSGDKKIYMPEPGEGISIRFCADYEQVIGEDGSIYTPLQTKSITGFYEVSNGTDVAKSSEFTFSVPGEYMDSENANQKPDVIPALQEWHGTSGKFIVEADSKIVADQGLANIAAEFAADYEEITGKRIQVVEGGRQDAGTGDFYMTLNAENAGLGKEGYIMTIGDTAVIAAADAVGAYWGTRTVLQILKQTGNYIAKGITRDYPKFKVRGFMLDVGRKPFSMDTLKEFTKNMAWYKMNDFHIHLNDNLIFLEDYNSRQDAIDNAYEAFRLESSIKNDKGKTATADDLYYTKDEFRDFIQESRTLGINIVPEIDMPAHAFSFTKVFPQYGLTQASGEKAYLIDHLDVRKQEVRDFAKNIWGDYLAKENPVFDKDTVLHAGTDEFYVDSEAFRQFSDEMIEYIQGEGRTVRLWGSLTAKTGAAPVRSKDVQLNIWDTTYADPLEMYDLGYDLINTLDTSLYIVPAYSTYIGGYGDRLNTQVLYKSWIPNKMGKTTISAADNQMLGATFAMWHDGIDTRGNGISEYDSFNRFLESLPTLSEKTWNEGKDKNWSQFKELSDALSTAPNTNPFYEVESKGSEVMKYSFDDGKGTDISGNRYDATVSKNAAFTAGNKGKALQLKGGESYLETPIDRIGPDSNLSFSVKMDSDAGEEEQILFESKKPFGNYGNYAIKAVQKDTGKVGFSREGSHYSFDYKLPKNKWVDLTIKTYVETAKLYVNGEFHSNAVMDNRGYKAARQTATLLLPVGRIGSGTKSFKGLIDNVAVVKEIAMEECGIQIDQSQMKASACSFHSGEGSTGNAIDGDPSTFWHTNWASPADLITDTHNHYFQVDLNTPTVIDGLSYLPRQDNANGRIFKYNLIITKSDNTKKTVVSGGTWATDTSKKFAKFAPIEAKSVRLEILEAGANHGTIAELNLYKEVTKDNCVDLLLEYTKLKKKDYTAQTWEPLNKAYTSMLALFIDEEISKPSDFTSAYQILKLALESLEPAEADKIDRSALAAALDAAMKIDTGAYTQNSVDAFKEAIAAARAVMEDEKADQAAVDAALKVLEEAKAGLKLVSDVEKEAALEALRKVAEQCKPIYDKGTGDYTQESWNAFEAAYQAVQASFESGKSDLEALIQLRTNLETTFAGLTKKKIVDPVKLAAPKIQSLSTVAAKKVTGVKITVSKVDGADSYTVYRKNGKQVKRIGNTDKNRVVYDKEPVSNKNVSYYAVADSKDTKYQMSDAGQAKTMKASAATSKVTVKQISKTQIRVSWKKVKNAKGFVIYRSDKKNSGYTRVKVIKKGNTLSFIDKKVTKGKKYYYGVVVKGENTYSGIRISKGIKVKK